MKRLNFDIHDELYSNFKAHCARKGVTMREEVVELISLVLEAKAELSREEGEPVETNESEQEQEPEDATTAFVIEGGRIVKKRSEEAPDESEELEEEPPIDWHKVFKPTPSVEPSVPPFLKKSNQNIPQLEQRVLPSIVREVKPQTEENRLRPIRESLTSSARREQEKSRWEKEEKPQRMQRTVAGCSACPLKSESAVLEHEHIKHIKHPIATEHMATAREKPEDEENLCPKCGTKLVKPLFGNPYCPKCWRLL